MMAVVGADYGLLMGSPSKHVEEDDASAGSCAYTRRYGSLVLLPTQGGQRRGCGNFVLLLLTQRMQRRLVECSVGRAQADFEGRDCFYWLWVGGGGAHNNREGRW